MRRPIAVDLFAGAGGFSLGVEQAGFDVVAAVEVDPVHCAVHEYNFPDCKVLCKSVTDLTGDEIRNEALIGDREIDLVVGGPPCQGVSMIGHRALDDPRNSLMLHFVRLVVQLNPRFFIMENVKGLTVGAHKGILTEVIDTFEKSGFEVERKYQVLNAVNFGVPQDRQRVFILGCRRGLQLPKYPLVQSIPARGTSRNGNTLFETVTTPTVCDALFDLPNADLFPELIDSDTVAAEFGDPSSYAGGLRGGRQVGDYSHPRETPLDLLTSSMRTIHTEESIRRFAETPNGDTEPISRFNKLRLDGVCNTLRAGTGSERGAYTSPRPIHPIYPRCITVREAARLHSYPDWFRFHVTKWHGFRQIGNSVPPMLARAVASEVLVAIGQLPELPSSFITPGSGGLLSIKMTQAANYYGVRGDVVGRRTRLTAGEIRYGERPAVSDSGNLQLELREGKRRRPTMATSE